MVGLWMFVGALVVAYLVPGPDMVLMMQMGGEQGHARALATAAGLAVARALHVAFAAIGLAAVLAALPAALVLLRLIGAAYLAWLAIGLLRAPQGAGQVQDGARGAAFRRGLFTNLLNPKALLFCSLLLPQFTSPAQGAMAGQFLLLGAILVGVGLLFDLAYGLSGGGLGRWFAAHWRLQRMAFAAVMAGFAIHLAVAAIGLS